MRGRINVSIKCKFSLGQNVPDSSYTNRIFGFILGETCAHGRSTRLCRKTLMRLGG